MDSEFTSIDFAAIGHQDSWRKIEEFVNALRKAGLPPLPPDTIKNTFTYIPPRKIFDIEINSAKKDVKIRGIYIETFISPDELQAGHFKKCMDKIRDASEIAAKHQAGITALGGFTSIILEGNFGMLHEGTTYTTGNTLTTAFIIKSIEAACENRDQDLQEMNVLILGSTGDIGSALTRHYASKCKTLKLHARNRSRLRIQEKEIKILMESCSVVENPIEDFQQADLIISVASSANILSGMKMKKSQIVCDAGYPKNLEKVAWHKDTLYYHGGMGVVTGGMEFSDPLASSFYRFPVENAIHGCLLEAIVLAFEKRHQAFSIGKGNITENRIEEILNLSQGHGILVAPFFNNRGLCQIQKKL